MSTRAVVIATLPVVALVVAILLLGLPGDDAALHESPLIGVSAEDFAELRIRLADDDADPGISRLAAIQIVRDQPEPGEVRQALLAEEGSELVWIVSMDPHTVEPVPPFGYRGPVRTKANGYPDYGTVIYYLHYVDAESGVILHTRSMAQPADYMMGSTGEELEWVGISGGGLDERGVYLLAVVGSDLASVDVEQARQVANDRYGPDASVREVKLARWGGEDVRSITKAQLLWVLNVDPATITPSQITGGSFGTVPPNPGGGPDDGEVQYLLVFVDAESGKYLDAVGSVRRPD